MSDKIKSFYGNGSRLLLILMVVSTLALAWIWASWIRGWFPFSSRAFFMQEEKTRQEQERILDSLTAPTGSKINPDVQQSVLDSLTPKK